MQGQRTINTASKGLLQRLQNFQCIFQHADASGDGSLDEDEFIAAFTGGHIHICFSGWSNIGLNCTTCLIIKSSQDAAQGPEQHFPPL